MGISTIILVEKSPVKICKKNIYLGYIQNGERITRAAQSNACDAS